MNLCKCLFVCPSNFNLELVEMTEANLFFSHVHKLATCKICDFRMLISQFNVCVYICGLDSQGSNQPCGHPWNSLTEGHRPQPSSLSETSALPTVTSHIPSQLQQPLQAGLPPRINYSQSPAAPALASVTQRG